MKRLWLLLVFLPHLATAQPETVVLPDGWQADPPAIASLVAFAQQESELRVAVNRYLEDQAAIKRRYPVQYSPVRHERLEAFHVGWQQQLEELDFDALSHEAQIDYIALRNRIGYNLAMLALDAERQMQIAPLLPFSDSIRHLQENRFDRQRIVPRDAAATLDKVATDLEGLTKALNKEATGTNGLVERAGISPTVAWRAANQVMHLRGVLKDWHTFYDGYDPFYNFWVREPYGRVDAALEAYATAINRRMVGIVPGEQPPIIGDPVLEAGLVADLTQEMIPYSAEELIRIGEREFEWTEARFREVSNEMGHGDDWMAALEHTKNLAPAPGEKPWVIFDIAAYSEEFLEDMGSISMPPLAREVWRLNMQTPERQLITPFFTGGEVTRVSYPTDGMRHPDKMMSMRGNTPHFNFATVHHELIPGHHLQGFMSNRFNPHRGDLLRTPFWGEGWALYWELLLWETDFARSNPDKIGMLFWRMHRAARIIFSLNYQLGRWTPEECVDFLVDRVGHERANAEAEVRRSTIYLPLYQIAYLIGGLQFKSLYDEVVGSGMMSAQDFHDAVMQGGRLPVELVRARLLGQELSPDFESQWRFYGNP